MPRIELLKLRKCCAQKIPFCQMVICRTVLDFLTIYKCYMIYLSLVNCSFFETEYFFLSKKGLCWFGEVIALIQKYQ